MAITIKNDSTLKNQLMQGVNLFLGAGFSVGSTDVEGRALPIGNMLKTEAIGLFDMDKYANLSLPKISRVIENSTSNAEWSRYLTNRFTVSRYEQYYQNLNQINLHSIFTTNIDNLVHEIIAKSDKYYINDITINGPVQNDKRAIQYIPLHGCVLSPSKGYIFSDEGISTTFSNDPDKWHMLTEAIQKRPTIFLGYGMNDSGVLEALSEDTIRGRAKKDLWLLARDEETLDYFEAIGFRTMLGETKDFLDWVKDVERPVEASSEKTLLDYTGLEKERLPSADKVPNVKLSEFFLGGQPQWCYIHNNSLSELSYGEDITESIYNPECKNQIVVGMAFSGKTTLMMQLANRIEYPGLKLVAKALNVEYSKYLVNKIAGRPTLMFVDDFTDDTYAYNILAEQDNIKIVGFTRDYNFELVSHIIAPVDRQNVIDMTELDGSDYAKIFKSIPPNLKNDSITPPREECNVFEFVQKNVKAKRTKEKLRTLYRDLKKTDELLLDCILFCCYINECGTPVSFDMLMAFLRDRVVDYEEIFEIMEQVKNMIKSYDLTFTSIGDTLQDQDYYQARSRVFSDSFMRIANPKDLKRVLIAFTENVSPFRVYEYKTFKRRGYDAKLYAKAFPNADEGSSVYEKLLLHDDTSYMKQQYAIYLSHVKDFPNAFRVIDEARSMNDKNVFSINNTYAMILYESNKNLDCGDEKVADALNESLRVFMDCYKNDKRKAFHAIRFGQYAMDYYSKYPHDSEAVEFLYKAQQWAYDELEKSSWSYQLKDIKRELEEIISTL